MPGTAGSSLSFATQARKSFQKIPHPLATFNGYPVMLSHVPVQVSPPGLLPLTPSASLSPPSETHRHQHENLPHLLTAQIPFPLRPGSLTSPLPSGTEAVKSTTPILASTNVHVRGLPPQVDDAALQKLGTSWGQVISVRTIRDKTMPHVGSPLCQGTGYIMFKHVSEAQRAVLALRALGLEATLANETVNLKLKRLEDENSSNLYLSNLPLDYDESDLRALFLPTQVCSARVLREYDHLPERKRHGVGVSRGVGFARLADRTAAEQAIKRLNKMRVPGASGPLKVRFADSQEQKAFKKAIDSFGPGFAGLYTPPSSPSQRHLPHATPWSTKWTTNSTPPSSSDGSGSIRPPSFVFSPLDCGFSSLYTRRSEFLRGAPTQDRSASRTWSPPRNYPQKDNTAAVTNYGAPPSFALSPNQFTSSNARDQLDWLQSSETDHSYDSSAEVGSPSVAATSMDDTLKDNTSELEASPSPLSRKRSLNRWSTTHASLYHYRLIALGLKWFELEPLQVWIIERATPSPHPASVDGYMSAGSSPFAMQQHAPPTTSDGPSSPTTSSFYDQWAPNTSAASLPSSSSRPRQPGNGRSSSYKSTTSVRAPRRVLKTSHAASSSPTSLSTVTFNSRRLAAARPAAQPRRDLSLGEPSNPFEPGHYGPGAMRQGEWEEWTDEENLIIGLEVMKAKRSWKARYETQMSSEMDEADYEAYADMREDQEEPEPPDDMLEHDSTPQPGSPIVSHLADNQLSPSQLYSSSQSLDSNETQSMSLDSTARPSTDQTATLQAIQAFEQAIIAAQCPSCSLSGSITGNEMQGALCLRCGWNVPAQILRATELAFATHHYAGATPLGVLVTCVTIVAEIQDMKPNQILKPTQGRRRVGPTPFVPSSRALAIEQFSQGYTAPLDTVSKTYSQPIGPSQSITNRQLPPTRLSTVPSSRLPSNPFAFLRELDYRDDYGDTFLPAELLESDHEPDLAPPSRPQSEPERYRARAPEPRRVVGTSPPPTTSVLPQQLKPGDPNPDWLEDALYGPAYMTSKSIPSDLKSELKGEFGSPIKLDYSKIEGELNINKSATKSRARRAAMSEEHSLSRSSRRKKP
ncbi:hypothetical protein OIV83_002027 [Microbotryomycetes sp. JL201]|nr:hypothetical protein OIV83_002027 [Microbotryomycetes sp. JL201]